MPMRYVPIEDGAAYNPILFKTVTWPQVLCVDRAAVLAASFAGKGFQYNNYDESDDDCLSAKHATAL